MDIQPFRGWRYDLGRVGALSEVVAPPYDVIDSALQDALYTKHPNNVVRLDLNKPEPGDNEQRNRYTRAARFLRDWQHEGILREEGEPAIYVYHQTFTVDRTQYTRRGVMARVRLERLGEGNIFAHEETMPGPKQDRLALMHATGMNLSPILSLYPDPTNEVQDKLAEAVRRTLPVEATDHLGTVNRLWPITDQRLISETQSLLFAKAAFIADGHHRYETALRYRDELTQGVAGAEVLRSPGSHRPGLRSTSAPATQLDADSPANFTLMMLVGMSDPGLLILPTHRLVSGIPALAASRLPHLLGPHFELEVVGKGPAAARAVWERIEATESQEVLGLGTVADDTWSLARCHVSEEMARLAPEHSVPWRNLAVSILHVLILNHNLTAGSGADPSCQYVHRLEEVTAAVAAKQCRLAVLVPPVTMNDVAQIAGKLEKMPPKSTYFYPKLLTGLVFSPLR